MPNNSLALPDALTFVPARARADTRSRLSQYQAWMQANGYTFTNCAKVLCHDTKFYVNKV